MASQEQPDVQPQPDGPPGFRSWSAYFRKRYEENPDWVEAASNEPLWERFEQDFPEVKPDANLRNLQAKVKALLRQKAYRKRSAPPQGKSSSTLRAYFRQLYKDHPEWLGSRGDGPLWERFEQDHPDEKVNASHRRILFTVKGNLLSKARRRQ